MYKIISSFCLVMSLVACSGSTADLGTIDAQQFRKDRGGCENIRGTMIENLKLDREKLLGLHENEVIKSLGRYDFQILDRKNEKVFIYYLEKGPQCEHMQNPSKATSMALYLNSISLVKEVTFQQGKP